MGETTLGKWLGMLGAAVATEGQLILGPDECNELIEAIMEDSEKLASYAIEGRDNLATHLSNLLWQIANVWSVEDGIVFEIDLENYSDHVADAMRAMAEYSPWWTIIKDDGVVLQALAIY